MHPKAWREQFRQFGEFEWIGEGLLKLLRVVSDGELRQGLIINPNDFLGMRVGHAYLRDDEPGSSWINIKGILERSYNADSIIEIDLARGEPEAIRGFDVLYIYEDGLWSGVEIVRRLASIAQWLSIKNHDLRLIFKYGVTCDAGLLAGRHFLRREKLTSVGVPTGGVEHYSFLRNGCEGVIMNHANADDEDIRGKLDTFVSPYVFYNTAIWNDRVEEAMQVCQEIGHQIVKPWLARTKIDVDLETEANRWALGAASYSSVTTFSNSVPKPVLPLLWLGGDVSYNGVKITWRPLFWDVRRTGQPYPADGREVSER